MVTLQGSLFKGIFQAKWEKCFVVFKLLDVIIFFFLLLFGYHYTAGDGVQCSLISLSF